tara:strand:+ start:243 stop:1334 length:1092 start_codon:yes stop_codon:yes gene_type:complete
MGAPFSTTLSDYTKAFSLTWGASWEKLVWLILEQSPLLYLMYKKGAIHLEAAPYARIPFAHAENPNVQTYQGSQVLNTADSEFAKPFIWDSWGQISCQSVVACDKVDLNQNAKRQIGKLLDAELTQCAITMRNFIEEQLHTASSVSGDIDGLRGMIEFLTPAAQAAGGTVVGNVAKTSTYHHNQYQEIAGGFMTDGIPAWTKLYRECSKFGRRPDVMLVDPAVYDGYEEWCGPERALVDEDMGSAGFTSLRFKGASVIPDYNITENSGEGFLLNLTGGSPSGASGHGFEPGMLDPVKGKSQGKTNLGNMVLWINPNAHFFMDDWRLAQEQWAWISKTKFHGILTVSNLREQGCFDFAGGAYSA